MKKKLSLIIKEIFYFGNMLKNDNIDAFAANSAYFFILSFIPLILLIISLIRYTSVTQESMVNIVSNLFPAAMYQMIYDIIAEVYSKSATAVSLSLIFTLWSAGKGFMALKNGLHAAVHIGKKHNYFFMRIMGALYALTFVFVIVASLVLGVFGGSIERAMEARIGFINNIGGFIIQFRKFIMLSMFILLFTVCYRLIPDWEKCSVIKHRKIRMAELLPGATTSAVGWHIYSSIFSFLYMKFSNKLHITYGSLSVLIGIMLWLYGCMYLILAGLEVNIYLRNLKDRLSDNEFVRIES